MSIELARELLATGLFAAGVSLYLWTDWCIRKYFEWKEL